ncbi:pre-mRNA-splicing factor ini1 [Cryptococcus neoformans]|uniref:Pre-mRNA-splicing factor ini1 n=1 Tax=Cryptococcus neoformans Tu259-1 TaxID=1230072 RepID=A0A854QHE3_CRYNE|nr:pre-mRNA-splicing factor ini1 [Cryptococcus neoformans var. grubii Tu259-1]OXG31236.1 pre-mRNA-splicing factor ini1 [Cryptococcus neoformans var. grubii Bt15]OXG39815.1 pre-mRNA-splicing factor ini1 [Cryptococcus neoformans var. grubii Bt120]OXG48687.1 pre-mRNA-splicing factor ini1 [Cryptococcus neoformans var. grubii Th84]OXH08453.1 pre-mRNA-splicing factor ini1 [Cryptococcus neoformans var. grubii]
MSKHHPDLLMCRRQPGIAIGRMCEKCDGKCPVCDSYVRPMTLVRICDECSFGTTAGKCIVCSSPAISDAYYCTECTRLEKDRDGCPRIINVSYHTVSVAIQITKMFHFPLILLWSIVWSFNIIPLTLLLATIDGGKSGGCLLRTKKTRTRKRRRFQKRIEFYRVLYYLFLL